MTRVSPDHDKSYSNVSQPVLVFNLQITRYEIRNPMFYLPDIRHSFSVQSIEFCMIK